MPKYIISYVFTIVKSGEIFNRKSEHFEYRKALELQESLEWAIRNKKILSSYKGEEYA